MNIDIDNALADTRERLPQLILRATYTREANTPENEPCWLVTFSGTDKQRLNMEIIIRDEAIVMSVLKRYLYNGEQVAKIMDVFMELLNIVP